MAGQHDMEARQDVGMVDRSLSIEEAAQHFGCSARTIRRRIKDGSLQAFERPIPRGFEWRILIEQPAKVDTGGRQTSGKHDRPARQESGKHDTGAETPGETKEPSSKEVLEPPFSPAPHVAEPGLLRALELIETLQREHRQEVEKLQQERMELYGRASFFQAKLQDAQERILMLEAKPAEEEQPAEPEQPPEEVTGSKWKGLLRKVLSRR